MEILDIILKQLGNRQEALPYITSGLRVNVFHVILYKCIKISSISSVTYGVAKEQARILKPLFGKTIYHVKCTKEFVDEVRNTKLEDRECITSYKVTALFTAVPVSSIIDIIKNRLEQDT